MSRRATRRAYLAGAGAVVCGSLAGCYRPGSEGDRDRPAYAEWIAASVLNDRLWLSLRQPSNEPEFPGTQETFWGVDRSDVETVLEITVSLPNDTDRYPSLSVTEADFDADRVEADLTADGTDGYGLEFDGRDGDYRCFVDPADDERRIVGVDAGAGRIVAADSRRLFDEGREAHRGARTRLVRADGDFDRAVRGIGEDGYIELTHPASDRNAVSFARAATHDGGEVHFRECHVYESVPGAVADVADVWDDYDRFDDVEITVEGRAIAVSGVRSVGPLLLEESETED